MYSSSLKSRTLKGIQWSAIDRFSSQGISFIIGIILARLLNPHDYGLLAMIGIFISLSQVFVDSGLSSALVRNNKRTEIDLSTAYYANIIIGIICYVLLFILAPLISTFYNEPALCSITRVMGIIFFLFSLSNVQQAILAIRIDFKTITKISIISVLISGIIGILLAYYNFGVWALVTQQVTAALLKVVLQWIYVRWRPKNKFSWESFKNMFSFGSKMLATGIVSSISDNLYTIIIGKYYSASNLGYYSRANQFTQVPSSTITNIVKNVTFPSMSIIQDEQEKFKNTYFKIQSIVSFVVFPLVIWLGVISDPLIETLLTYKWIRVADLMKIICIGFMWYPIYTQNLNILEVKGYSGYILQSELITRTISIVLLLIALPYGLNAVCFSQVLTSIISVLISNYFVSKKIVGKYFLIFRYIYKNLLFSIISGVTVFLIQSYFNTNILKLFFSPFIGLFLYIFLHFVLNKKYLISFLSIIQNKDNNENSILSS